MKWSCGVTTCPDRIEDLLPRTLASLQAAGFDPPRLFVDGTADPTPWNQFCLEITVRSPSINISGNWVLGVAELYLRDPTADFYAMFQDDLVTMRNLRFYLEKCRYPENGYWNLYTFPQYATALGKDRRWQVAPSQRGLGAVGLVFSRNVLLMLLSAKHLYARANADPKRSLKAIDGGIVESMKQQGMKEYVHVPSLIQHTGTVSTVGNSRHPTADTFPGESYDALDLLEHAP